MAPRDKKGLRLLALSSAICFAALVLMFLLNAPIQSRQHFSDAIRAIHAEDFERANAGFALARRTDPDDPAILLESARLARRQREYLVAQDFLAAAEKWGALADDIRVEEQLVALQRFGPTGNEVALLERLKNGTPHEARIREAMAESYFRELAYVPALRHAERWTMIEPNSGRAWLSLAVAQSKLEDKLGAVESYKKAQELNPNSFDARLGYAQVLALLLRHRDASEQFEIAFRQNPRHKELRFDYGTLLVDLEQTARANEVAGPLYAEYPNDPLVVGLAGRVALQLGRLKEAEPLLKSAAEKTNEPVIVLDYQRCLQKLNKHDEAKAANEWHLRIRREIGELRELTEKSRNSDDPDSRLRVGKILIQNGFGDAGIAWLHDALRVAPDFKPAHVALADYYDSIGKTDRAVLHRREASRK